MSVAGDTGYLANTLALINAQALLQLDKVSVTRNLVSVKSAPKADTLSWIVYNDGSHIINAADVAATAEGTVTPTSKLSSAKKTATLDMYSVSTDLYDEAKFSNADNPEESIGIILGNAMAAAIDTLINANFANFTNTVGTSTVGVTVDNLFSALAYIEVYQHLGEIYGVFDRRQLWGTYGLMNDLITSNQFGGSPAIQSEGLMNGFVNKVAGINLYNSNTLAAAASSAQKAGIFTREALGWAWSGPSEIRVSRDYEPRYLRDVWVASSHCGTCEIKDSAGVYVHTKVTA